MAQEGSLEAENDKVLFCSTLYCLPWTCLECRWRFYGSSEGGSYSQLADSDYDMCLMRVLGTRRLLP